MRESEQWCDVPQRKRAGLIFVRRLNKPAAVGLSGEKDAGYCDGMTDMIIKSTIKNSSPDTCANYN